MAFRIMLILLLAAATAHAGLTNGLVAHYPFDGNASDTTGNGNDGVLVGGATFTNGLNGQALSVANEGDYVQIIPSVDLNFGTGPKTLSVWFKARTLTNAISSILDKTDTSNYSLGILTQYNPGTNTLRIRMHDGTDYVNFLPEISLIPWHHVVMLWDTTNLIIYLDAKIIFDVPFPYIQTTTNALIVGAGGSPYQPGYQFNGLIQDLRFYNRVLSPAEIQGLYLWLNPALSISPGTNSNTVNIIWQTGEGRTAQMQSSTNFLNWQNIGPAILSDGTPGTVTAPVTTSRTFYRVQIH